MKVDIANKTNRFAKRTLAAFSESMFSLLEGNALENITVQKLCDSCNYPRSTFYNYFEDIYDLMDYCWITMTGDMAIEKYAEIPEADRTTAIFAMMYDYLYERRPQIKKVLAKNGLEGKMMFSLRKFMRKQIKERITSCQYTKQYSIRADIVVDFYAGTIEMLLEKCFFEEKELSRDEAIEALSLLIGNIEKEVCGR